MTIGRSEMLLEHVLVYCFISAWITDQASDVAHRRAQCLARRLVSSQLFYIWYGTGEDRWGYHDEFLFVLAFYA